MNGSLPMLAAQVVAQPQRPLLGLGRSLSTERIPIPIFQVSLLDTNMVFLNEVPNDILLCIFEVCSRRSITELSKVNRRFHILSQPQLYNTINWKWLDNNWKGEGGVIPPILLLLRTIFTTPDVARLIHFVKLEGNSFCAQGPYRRAKSPKIPLDSISASELDIILSAVKSIQSKIRMPLGQENLLAEEFRAGTMDAMLPILLSQLPNLRFLHLAHNFTKEIPLLAIVLKTLLCSPEQSREGKEQTERFALSSFESLQEVTFTPSIDSEGYRHYIPFSQRNITWGESRRDIVYTAVLPFLYAPRIERIRATIEEPHTAFHWLSWDDSNTSATAREIPPPIAKTLKHLDITLLREENLGKILAQCPKLEALRWKFRANPHRMYPAPFLDCRVLEGALENVKGTLTSLVLELYFEDSRDISEYTPVHGILSTLTSLRSFPLLERLAIPWVLLLGLSPSLKMGLDGVLPRGLKELVLTDDLFCEWSNDENRGEWEDEDILLVVVEKWLEEWREDVPRLQKVIFWWGSADTLEEKFEGFEERFGCQIEVVFDGQLIRTLEFFWQRIEG